MASDAQKVELLFKKYSGAVDAYPGSAVSQEVPVPANSRIIPSLQIYAQPIPSVAPTDLTIDATFTDAIRKTSTLYPHIVKYENLDLGEVNPGYSYRYVGTTKANPAGTNLLSCAIPSNFDSIGSYAITVYSSTGVTIPSNDTVHPGYLILMQGI